MKVDLILSIFLSFACWTHSETRVLQLFGNLSLSWYYVNLYIGNPPQIQSLFPDTGSDLTVFVCKGCLSCFKNKRYALFDRRQSFTNRHVLCGDRYQMCQQRCQNKEYDTNCQYEVKYGDQTGYTGAIYQDQVRFSLAKSQNEEFFVSEFGCTVDEQRSYYLLTENGLLGLSQGKDNLFGNWFKRQLPSDRKIGLCYNKNGGYLELGNVLKPQGGVTLNIYTEYFYSLMNIKKVQFGKADLMIGDLNSKEGLIIDSGSTFTYIPHEALEKVISELKSICSAQSQCEFHKKKEIFSATNQNTFCFYIHPDYWKKVDQRLPSIEISTTEGTLRWAPSQFLISIQYYIPQNLSEENHYCLGMRTSKSLKMRSYILGITWLQGKKVILDSSGGTVTIYDNINCEYKERIQTYKEGSITKVLYILERKQTILAFLVAVVFIILFFLRKKLVMYFIKKRQTQDKETKAQNNTLISQKRRENGKQTTEFKEVAAQSISTSNIQPNLKIQQKRFD